MLVYYTTIWTPYHETICRELANRLGDEFKLVLTEPIDASRNFGWDLRAPKESWIIPPPDSYDQLNEGIWPRLILSADIAVLGALCGHRALFRAVDKRVSSEKLTFFMGERPFKQGLKFLDFLCPYNWYVWWRLHRRYNRRNVHFLAIGHGVRDDLTFLRVHNATIHPWAYFPAVSSKPPEKTDSKFLRICWCGRMIACKHVEVLLQAVASLPSDVMCQCRVTIAGEGEMRTRWMSLAAELHLGAVVSFLPVIQHDKALFLMETSDVYVFPSDGEEGWGVAVEEAMDKGCVPIACREAGAPRALIEDGVSGFFFPVGDARCLAEKIIWLLNEPVARRKMGAAAWRCVQRRSPQAGVKQLLSYTEI